MSDLIETTLFTCPLVYIYSIPPLKSISAGHVAGQWPVDNPLWQGRLRVVEVEGISQTHSANKIDCHLKLEDSNSGELFAIAPYSKDGNGVTAASDSSRFFAITVVDGDRRAVLGMGFPDRNSSFEFNIALQDYKRHSNPQAGQQFLNPSKHIDQQKDYSLKEGQMIHVNISGSNGAKDDSTEDAEANTVIPMLLPPPPSSRRSKNRQASPPKPLATDDDFGDFQ
ncbi:hypothetical protein AWJ20_3328 [Sugiyamaella lignohabitans]|uniref:NECAP PHear domain-containing protein n=1 Tax=Sugiyamaella lignohabitans TaxID=796027 RepID=A0A167FTN9_9ASCO|nr:uncharacterized protein AWJ20_3328 [Sugiyamaella lignohabitans]ANB15689.1 hypothetical protein AWJ20_3328 [Sugiyamaella lignohabitans]